MTGISGGVYRVRKSSIDNEYGINARDRDSAASLSILGLSRKLASKVFSAVRERICVLKDRKVSQVQVEVTVKIENVAAMRKTIIATVFVDLKLAADLSPFPCTKRVLRLWSVAWAESTLELDFFITTTWVAGVKLRRDYRPALK
jgi:hypothetical protein